MKQRQDELEAMSSLNQQLETKLNQRKESYMKDVNVLRCELSKTNAAFDKLRFDNRERILELTRERDLSKARLKQAQNGIAQQNITNETSRGEKSKDDSDDTFYEVENLLADKMIQKRAYLVHWKGFDSSHDSWVYEADLNCPNILKKYKQFKRK